MPKIIINEYDNTQAGVSSYENFTVLVPGLVAQGMSAENFDEHGVCELNSLKDFKEKIGIVPPSTTEAWEGGKAAKSAVVSGVIDDENAYLRALLSIEKNAPYVCTRLEITDDTNKKPGRLKYQDTDNKWYALTIIDDKDRNFEQELVDNRTPEEEPVAPLVQGYFLVKPDDVGNDTEAEIFNGHYGNQMAYLLLKLGYSVLYKKIKTVGETVTDETTGEEKTIVDILSDPTFWEGLADKSLYDFRYIVTGLLDNNAVPNEMIAILASFVNQKEVPVADISNLGRGDCIALLDIPAGCYTEDGHAITQAKAIEGITLGIGEVGSANKFSAFFAPYVIYGNMADEGYFNKTLPASFHYLACAANAFTNLNFREWYAVAGYTRGVAGYVVTETGCRLGENATNILQPRTGETVVKKAVNLIIKNKTGYYLWGNRTANSIDPLGLKASDFLNIRQLCTTLKKQIYIACRKFTFDPNSDILWINFVDAIEPTLKAMKADQGISDYKFIKVKTNLKGVLRAKIRIVPIEAVEDFHINLYLEDDVSGTTVEIEEA